ncbi:MAG TPA: PQQ-binding-like beta-propeller repeat protein [Anaerolineales bacterium]|nr:PQQ-binding-like beta-propeller repeat protein [Anaerolineales bacterium]
MIKPKYILLITLLILLSLAASGCRGSGAVASSWPGITLDGDTAYVAYNQNVYAIDLEADGRQLDTLPTDAIRGATFFHKPLLIGDDQLVQGSYSQDLYLIDTDNGASREFFTDAKNRWIGAPLSADGVIYAPNSNGNLYALSYDGEELWHFETEASLWASPLLDGDVLYIASMDHYLYAVDIHTENLIWKTDLGGSLVSGPVIAEDGTLYIGSFDSNVYAIDSQNGSVLWDFATTDWVWGSPTVGPEGVVYATDLSANIYALDSQNGDLIWDKQVEANSRIIGSVLFHNDTLYVVAESGVIAAYDTEGERLWKESIGEGNLYGTPVMAGDNLILASALNAEAVIYAYDADLEPLWQYLPNDN